MPFFEIIYILETRTKNVHKKRSCKDSRKTAIIVKIHSLNAYIWSGISKTAFFYLKYQWKLHIWNCKRHGSVKTTMSDGNGKICSKFTARTPTFSTSNIKEVTDSLILRLLKRWMPTKTAKNAYIWSWISKTVLKIF